MVPELGKRDAEDFFHLDAVASHDGARRRPDDDRCNEIARARRVIVEPADNRARIEGNAQLLRELAQSRSFDAFARVDPTSGERELSSMSTELWRSRRQEECCFVRTSCGALLFEWHDNNGDGCALQICGICAADDVEGGE